MNYKLLFTIIFLHVVFIISGYFVLQYAVFLLLSQAVSVHILGYLFLLLFLGICVLIHYLVVDLYGIKASFRRKWIFSVSGMCFSTFVAFLFLAFLF
ncbi:hypothetical protein DS745_00980 [Anaerobacillus alkaliphilus]|uniref:Uncharacterized protein n=1 Tax=Anaerobacillus alkaliphilus TaxID=1548597 RepID=A0A4Q0VWA9_9BACI|nr:hypothetical protein [Anaerobacillus alkaliphilus]RXJ03997.1 hypothetical protein DS745_00980 [Anaerobacillus alkaliphilus]